MISFKIDFFRKQLRFIASTVKKQYVQCRQYLTWAAVGKGVLHISSSPPGSPTCVPPPRPPGYWRTAPPESAACPNGSMFRSP